MRGRTVETVVTYLEMAARPRSGPSKPADIELVLLRARRIPLPFYRYLYAAVGAKWLWYERLLLDDAALSRKVHHPAVEIAVVHADGAPAGYYELDFSAPARANLVYFGLTPEWSGRGIGPWLLGVAIAEGFSRGATALTVNTCTLDHPAALPLYRKLGFTIASKQDRRLLVPADIHIPDHIPALIGP